MLRIFLCSLGKNNILRIIFLGMCALINFVKIIRKSLSFPSDSSFPGLNCKLSDLIHQRDERMSSQLCLDFTSNNRFILDIEYHRRHSFMLNNVHLREGQISKRLQFFENNKFFYDFLHFSVFR